MRFPWRLNYDLAGYLLSNRIRKIEKFPLVLMLEPTHLCSLACTGCGRVREYAGSIDSMMSLDECFSSVDECPAPIVTITGGEPFLYPPVFELTEGVLRRGKHVQFCTNGLLLESAIERMPQHPNLTLNVHMDGMEETHDRLLGQMGAFRAAAAGIRKAKSLGFRVCTNTTIYKNSDMVEMEMLFSFLTETGVDGLLAAPGFDYGNLDDDLFLQRRDIEKNFARLCEMQRRFRFWSTPQYLRFLKGEIQLDCTPWGNPTRNPKGWKAPCYLITDAHYPSFREMMESVAWERYGVGRDERCRQCMMHCGFEPTVVNEISKSWKLMREMIVWNLT